MPMRLSGLVTGMDTEALVGQLMSAQSLKKKKVTGAKTKLEWKKDAWKELNKKLTSFYNGTVSKMRLSSAYNLKKAKVSDESKATITADPSAVTGNYTMEVEDIASAQFLTSAKNEKITSTGQKLSEIDSSLLGQTITVNGPSGKKELTIDENTKVSDFISTMQSAGLNANYDTTQQKFFISSKQTGAKNAFSITATGTTSQETTALNGLKSTLASAAGKASFDELYAELDDDKKSALDASISRLATADAAEDDALVNSVALQMASTIGVDDEESISSIQSAASTYAQVGDRTTSSSALSALGLANVESDGKGNVKVDGVTFNDGDKFESGMALIKAKDSKVILNGAEITSASSTVTANGLSINLVSKTNGTPVTFSVTNDIDGAYENVKKALKEYNDLLKEMNEKYNAASSKGYEPLTAEEKRALSDDEVEEWEKKIKDSLFRRDSKLEGIMSGMRSAMQTSVRVGDKSYSLSSFGIMTSTDYREGGLLHIYGDPDDDVYSGEQDKLKKALTENPDDTIKALSDIFDSLRKDMFGRMGATEYSSALTFYDDKQMDVDLDKYKTDIKKWDDKLAAMEDQYYKKFSAMETAMAKLQSQSSSVLSLFGGQ